MVDLGEPLLRMEAMRGYMLMEVGCCYIISNPTFHFRSKLCFCEIAPPAFTFGPFILLVFVQDPDLLFSSQISLS